MPTPNSASYPSAPSAYASAYPSASAGSAGSYPGLAEYMGLELTEAEVRANMPEYLPAVVQVQNPLKVCQAFFCLIFSHQTHLCPPKNSSIATVPGSGLIAPISGLSTGLAKAQVRNKLRGKWNLNLGIAQGSDMLKKQCLR